MKKNTKIQITLIKSPIGYKPKAKKTLEALGLKKINQSVIHVNNECINGMVNKIDYLIKIKEL
ncbi:50S ribosomal protein L30 [Candidatus Marinimicrobia bacterium]|jgi:large subunit ribosomal protein L30|nr:50S ribosomal protein L30 [Candidatus Neomarinimicrobiota bacterium]|tara:strand:+ start:22 stop:210 length:189 start_codon:yes stop_codon:yes gene_type:complete